MEYLGWAATFIVLLGFWLNAKRYVLSACVSWIIGDIGWVIYNIHISNWSHMTLAGIIVIINSYAIYNILQDRSIETKKIKNYFKFTWKK